MDTNCTFFTVVLAVVFNLSHSKNIDWLIDMPKGTNVAIEKLYSVDA